MLPLDRQQDRPFICFLYRTIIQDREKLFRFGDEKLIHAEDYLYFKEQRPRIV